MPDLPQLPRRFQTSQFASSSFRPVGRSNPSLPPAPPGVPQLGASPYGSLARALNDVGQGLGEIGRQLQAGAVADAADEGANAVGTDENGNPTVELRSNSSASGRAYNQAAKMGFLASFERAHSTRIKEAESEYEGNPEGFATWVEAYISEAANTAAEQDPVLQGPATQALERYANQGYEGIIGRKRRSDISNSHDELVNRANASLEDAKRLARQGGTNTQDFAETWGSFSDITKQLGDNPEFAALGRNPAWASETLLKAEEQVADAALEGVVEGVANTRDAEGGLKAVESILDEAGFSDALREEKRLEWRAKVIESAAGRLVFEGQDDAAKALIALAPENFVAGEGVRAFDGALVNMESGGDPTIVNKFGYAGLRQYGAPHLATLGLYTPGKGENLDNWSTTSKNARGKWSGSFNIPGHPEVWNLQDFLNSPEAQNTVAQIDAANMDKEIDARGLDKYIGKTIGGTEVTREGIYGMMHLGGASGAERFLATGGRSNPKDDNGTALSDYLRMGAENATAPQLSSRGVALTTKVDKQIAQRDAQHSGLRREVGNAYAQAKKGLAATEQSMEDLRGRVNGSGDEELIAGLAMAERTFAFNRDIQTSSPAALEGWIGQERARLEGRGTQEELDRLSSAEATLKKMRTELSSDPLTWASSAGLIEVAPIDFANAETMNTRRLDATAVSEHYGVEAKFLTAAERDMLTNQFRDPDPNQRLGVAMAVAKGFGEDAPRAISEIAKDNPAAAHLTRLLTLGSEFVPAARAGFKGLSVAKGTAAQKKLADEVIGNAIDGSLSSTRDEITQAANAIYASWAEDRGFPEFDKAVYREAVQTAAGLNGETGGIGSYNGRNVLLPPHMDDSDLKTTVRNLRPVDLALLSAHGGSPTYGKTPLAPEDLRDAYLVSIGPGVYQVSITDPNGTPSWVSDDFTGDPYALDLSERTP